MYRYILVIVFLTSSCADLVQGKTNPGNRSHRQDPNTPRISRAGGKRIRVVAGKYQTILNLSADISGCLSVWDPMEHRPRGSPDPKTHRIPLDLRVVDRIHQDSKYYIVILAGAAPNCNVQARCGGSDNDMTLIWLKMNDHLNLEVKQAVLINCCLDEIGVVDPDEWDNLKLVRGELIVEYETQAKQSGSPTRSHLVYDRKLPEKGFIIRTEK